MKVSALTLTLMGLAAAFFLGCGGAEPRVDPEALARHDARIAEGRSLARQGKLAAAVAAFEDATYAYPESGEAHYLYAKALDELGRSYQAVDALRVAERLRPDDRAQEVLLGELLLRVNKLREAEEVLSKAVTQWPDDPRAHYNLGALRARQGRLEQAERSLRRAVKLAPSHSGSQEMLGRVLLRQGQIGDAVERYRLALELDECDDLAQGGLGAAFLISGHPAEAQAAFRRAVDCSEGRAAMPWRLSLALALAAGRSFDEALTALDGLGSDGGESGARVRGFLAPEVFNALRSRIDASRRGWHEAGCGASADVCSPANGLLWSGALMVFVFGAPDVAEGVLRRSLERFDGDATTHWVLAEALAELERVDNALAEIDRASAWQPSDELSAAMTALRTELTSGN